MVLVQQHCPGNQPDGSLNVPAMGGDDVGAGSYRHDGKSGSRCRQQI